MPTYDIFAISTHPTSADIRNYRQTRLTALETDPSSFLSTYEQEVALPAETWKERLSGSEKATFVARPSTSSQNTAESEPFVGMVTVLPARTFPLPLPVACTDPSVAYLIVAMWIAPEHRRRGLGQDLLQASLAWAAKDVSRDTSGAGDPEKQAEVFLFLALDNAKGRGLYEKSGFDAVAVTTAPGGRGEIQWMRRWVDASNTGRTPTAAA
ncbi:hypothetical protein VTO73DRAFT_9714 [Trametes versicolor]